MILGALLDVGLPLDTLKEALAKLPVKGFAVECATDRRGGVTGTRVSVVVDRRHESGHSIQEFIDLISQSNLEDPVKEQASEVLRRLGHAESKAHRAGSTEEPLHELGSIDTLVDVVGAVAGFRALGLEKLYASPLPTGSGIVSSAHGALPVPAPATLELIAMATAPVAPSQWSVAGEMLTPTGAAIITTLATFQRPLMTVEKVGYGLGSRDFVQVPNALAVWVGQTEAHSATRTVVLLETNLDDATPEVLGYVQERLLALGALDVWFTSIQMKKGRPGVMLCVLSQPHLERIVVDTILRETPTLGVRVRYLERHEAERETVQFPSSLGVVPVKVKRLAGRAVEASPEYEACKDLALKLNLPLQEVYRIVTGEACDSLVKSEAGQP